MHSSLPSQIPAANVTLIPRSNIRLRRLSTIARPISSDEDDGYNRISAIALGGAQPFKFTQSSFVIRPCIAVAAHESAVYKHKIHEPRKNKLPNI